MSELLTHFQLSPEEVAALDAERFSRVTAFLVRWEAYAEALACCTARQIRGDRPPPEILAAALRGLGRWDEALRTFAPQLQQTPSLPAQLERARLYLAAGDVTTARRLASELTNGAAEISPAWQFLGEALLADGALAEAEALFLQLAQLAPASHTAQLGLMRVHWRRNRLVAAAAYAVRALALAEQGAELTPAELGEVRAFFTAADDANRIRAVNRRLVASFDRELAALRTHLGGKGREPVSPAPAIAPAPALPEAVPAAVQLSPQERTALEEAVRQRFGYPALRPNQAEILASVLRGEDVLAVLPTGAGKSLCYQFPAFQGEGVTLVVSPLIALMKDQIDGLPRALRRQAVAVNSSLDGDDLRRIVERIGARHYRLVYVAPERLRQLPFVDALRRAGVARLVVDEAHCVSIWGHDFRPDYLHLAQAHRDLSRPPLLAMTATAPPGVRQEIEQQLLGRTGRMRVLVGDTFRPNLQLTVHRVRDDDERLQRCVEVVRTLTGATQPTTRNTACGIVYARSRQRCEEVAARLRNAGIDAAHYHAGIDNRVEVQDRFMRGEVRVIVATIAFGMGVDKPDIRFVVHYGLPDSVEGYYQEIGRAGRDGEAAQCVLLYTDGDGATLARLAGRGQLTVEQARAVYQAVRAALGDESTGSVALAALAQTAKLDEDTVRVALSLLEQAGVLRRGHDVPQRVTVQRLPQRRLRPGDPACEAFLRRIGLGERAVAAGEFTALAAAAGIAPAALEAQLLAWQADARLRYQPQGRTLLLTLPALPADAGQRVASLLSQRAAIAQQRVVEIVDFAHCDECRHRHLAHYLGGQRAAHAGGRQQRCGACDNCGAGLGLTAASDEAATAANQVLAALAEQSWGKRTLVRLLRGDPAAPPRAQQASRYGVLRARSEQSIGQLVESLMNEQLIAARELDHGGVTLELTSRGRKVLHQGSRPPSQGTRGHRPTR